MKPTSPPPGGQVTFDPLDPDNVEFRRDGLRIAEGALDLMVELARDAGHDEHEEIGVITFALMYIIGAMVGRMHEDLSLGDDCIDRLRDNLMHACKLGKSGWPITGWQQ
jgi:hypothetical protein